MHLSYFLIYLYIINSMTFLSLERIELLDVYKLTQLWVSQHFLHKIWRNLQKRFYFSFLVFFVSKYKLFLERWFIQWLKVSHTNKMMIYWLKTWRSFPFKWLKRRIAIFRLVRVFLVAVGKLLWGVGYHATSKGHGWELPGNYLVFTVVMAIYH